MSLYNHVSARFALQSTLFIFGLINCFGSSFPETKDTDHPGAGLFTDNTIVVGKKTRIYDYYIPDLLGDSPCPLVIILHGGGSNTDDMTGESGFKAPYKVWMDIADTERFIAVFPEGTTNRFGAPGWNDCRADATTHPSVDDVGFIEQLINKLISFCNIDENRIYATGTSNGGIMSLRLALELSDRIAAVAPVVAAMPAISLSSPVHPISILFMNGTEDPLLPYSGGEVAPDIGGRGTVLSARDSVNYWVRFNRADSNPVVADLPDLDVNDGSTVRTISYSGGDEGTVVMLYEISGGGHLEPSILEQYSTIVERMLGRQNHDIEMAEEIWNFFRDKTLK